MHLETEVTKLRKITDIDEIAIDLIRALNSTLLTGTNPVIIIRVLQSIEDRTASDYKN